MRRAAVAMTVVLRGSSAAAAPLPARFAAPGAECLAETTAFMSTRTGARVALAPTRFADSDQVPRNLRRVFAHDLGYPTEPTIATALTRRHTGACPPVAATQSASLRGIPFSAARRLVAPTGAREPLPAPMRGALAAALVLLSNACAQPTEPPPRPARLVQPDSECRTEIATFVAARTSASVTLAADTLTASDRLLLERQTRRDAQGRPLDGRRTEAPLAFVLRQEKGQCVLYEEASGASTLLIQCRCAALVP